jgi:hypothetical protein
VIAVNDFGARHGYTGNSFTNYWLFRVMNDEAFVCVGGRTAGSI